MLAIIYARVALTERYPALRFIAFKNTYGRAERKKKIFL